MLKWLKLTLLILSNISKIFQHITYYLSINGIFHISYFILSLQNPVCILHLQYISIHAVNGYFIDQ